MKKYLVIAFIAIIGFTLNGFNVEQFLKKSDSEKMTYVISFVKDKISETNIFQKKEYYDNISTENNYNNGYDKYTFKKIDGLNKCDYLLKRSGYQSCYSAKYKIPLLVMYKLEKDKVNIKGTRPSGFKVDLDLRKKDRTTTYDYTNSGYDRGHMAENASLDHTDISQKETFLMTNVVPQNRRFNQGAWRILEEYTREEANKYGYVYIVTGAIPGNKNIKNRINVPSKMYKIIFYPDGSSKQWIYPNDSSVLNKNYKARKYETTLKELSKLTKQFTF